MPDEDLKQFAAKINSHFPRGSDDRYRFAHLGRDPNEPAPAPPAPSPGPASPVESVQGASENALTDVWSERMLEADKEMDQMVRRTVPEMLMQAADTYRERNKLYGDNYKNFGKIMVALFPNGITVNDVDAWNRLGIFIQMCAKFTRYAEQFDNGGHDDSLLDLSVYSTMLRELDVMENARE